MKLNLFNGNGQAYAVKLPKIVIHTQELNKVALEWIAKQTDLIFEKKYRTYEAQPIDATQIARLLLTYNFKTRYFNNWNFKNELHLKLDHHHGYDIESICFECVQRNHIRVNDLKEGDFLAC